MDTLTGAAGSDLLTGADGANTQAAAGAPEVIAAATPVQTDTDRQPPPAPSGRDRRAAKAAKAAPAGRGAKSVKAKAARHVEAAASKKARPEGDYVFGILRTSRLRGADGMQIARGRHVRVLADRAGELVASNELTMSDSVAAAADRRGVVTLD